MYYGIGTPSYGNPYNIPAPAQIPAVKTEIVSVNGRNGAEMYRMAPDSSALLLDGNDPIIWFVKTDGAGYKTIIPYDIKPHEEKQQIDQQGIEDRFKDFDERLKAIEEALK